MQNIPLKTSFMDTIALPEAEAAQLPSTSIAFPPAALPALVLLILVAGCAALAGWLAKAPPAQQQLAGFSTSLKGRTRNQRHNAELAARSIDGRIIPPNGVFSYNQAVKSWSVDQGYVKALVSYDGELVRAYGGGVCQTSTTLYNAILLAGLPVLERHPHVFVPHYITPGRDAAVAFPGIDLRFRNPNPWPIRIRAGLVGDRLEVSLLGATKPQQKVSIKTEILSVTMPQHLTRVVSNKADRPRFNNRVFRRSVGATGYRVVTTRVLTSEGTKVRRETLSDDTYPAMDQILVLDQ
jgi:vancomycin resistance protein VanW